MEIHRSSTDFFYVYIGEKSLGGRITPQRFNLGSRWEKAKQLAEQIESLWQEQGGLWTEEGLQEARGLVKGWEG